MAGMKSKQLIALGVALVAIVVLAMMPKAVLKKPGAEAEANRDNAKGDVTEATAPASKKQEDTHAMSLSPAKQEKVNQWRQQWQSSSKAKPAFWAVDSMAIAFVEVGLYDSAALYREAVANMAPTAEHRIAAGDVNYDAYTLALNEERKKKYLDAARKWYTAVTDADAKNLDAKSKLALTFVDSDNPMQGILMLRDVVKENPNHELATYNLGLMSMRTRQWDKAVERFQKLAEINPQSTQAYFYLGVSYKELGETDLARKALQQAKALTKDEAVLSSIDDALEQLGKPAS